MQFHPWAKHFASLGWLGIYPSPIVLAGGSAGGHLAAAVALPPWPGRDVLPHPHDSYSSIPRSTPRSKGRTTISPASPICSKTAAARSPPTIMFARACPARSSRTARRIAWPPSRTAADSANAWRPRETPAVSSRTRERAMASSIGAWAPSRRYSQRSCRSRAARRGPRAVLRTPRTTRWAALPCSEHAAGSGDLRRTVRSHGQSTRRYDRLRGARAAPATGVPGRDTGSRERNPP